MKTKTLEQLKIYENEPRELRVALGEYIKSFDITPNKQYVKLLEYLLKNDEKHPSVDDIYLGLSSEFPELSRSRVYTILDLLSRAGVVRRIQVGKDQLYYDGITTPHAHLICKKCGGIENVDIKKDLISFADVSEDIQIDSVKVLFSGLCAECVSDIE